LLRTEDAAVGDVVESTSVRDLPLNGRRLLDLALTVPGSHQGHGAQAGNMNPLYWRPGPASSLTVGGNRPNANYFLIDGATNTDPTFNTQMISLSPDAVREFQVQTGTYSAELGGGGGGQINIITRSGAADFHGTAYEFLRNGALDSRSFNEAPGGRFLVQNNFGAALGGPLAGKKTFFSANYEALRNVRAVTAVGTVPTEQEAAGDSGVSIFNPFSQRANPRRTRTPTISSANSALKASDSAARARGGLLTSTCKAIRRSVTPIRPRRCKAGTPFLKAATHLHGSAADTASKIGGSYRRFIWPMWAYVLSRGYYQFTNGYTTQTATADGTGSALASMELGLPAVRQRQVGSPHMNVRQWYADTFIQDTWRLGPSTTVSIGLRHEFMSPLTDVSNQWAGLFATPTSLTAYIGGQLGYPKGLLFPNKRNFAPRLGLARQVPAWGLVVRGGYGLFYTPVDMNTWCNNLHNVPIVFP
jgi:hypothetical protein